MEKGEVVAGGTIEAEILRQPEAWRAAARIAREHAALLPARGESAVVAGCGTSWWISTAIALHRDQAEPESVTDAQAASLLAASPARLSRYSRLIAISRTGTTSEVVGLLKAVRAVQDAPRTLAIVEDAGTPAAKLADDVIVLPAEGRESVVQTVFATANYAMWRAHLGEDLEPPAAEAARVLASPAPSLEGFGQVIFLGDGAAYGLAQEAALKLREIAGFSTIGYPSLEVRHGATGAFTGGATLVWALGPQPRGVLADMAATGAAVWHHGERDPLVELVQVQRAAVAFARAHGRDPERPPHLSRSVVLAAGLEESALRVRVAG